jgi:hypothetical protein
LSSNSGSGVDRTNNDEESVPSYSPRQSLAIAVSSHECSMKKDQVSMAGPAASQSLRLDLQRNVPLTQRTNLTTTCAASSCLIASPRGEAYVPLNERTLSSSHLYFEQVRDVSVPVHQNSFLPSPVRPIHFVPLMAPALITRVPFKDYKLSSSAGTNLYSR